jgi:hypothetical protein
VTPNFLADIITALLFAGLLAAIVADVFRGDPDEHQALEYSERDEP